MPIYEYLCKDCEQIVEEWQKDFSDRVATCPICGGDAQRIISNTSFVLKGTGWYVTDYQGDRANGSNSKTASEEGANETAAAACESAPTADAPKKVEAKTCAAPPTS